MECYTKQEVREYTTRIREIMNRQTETLTDAKALALIEEYVFRRPKAGSCSSRQNSALIRRGCGDAASGLESSESRSPAKPTKIWTVCAVR